MCNLSFLYIGRVHGEISGCTVLGEVHPASAQNKSLISDTVCNGNVKGAYILNGRPLTEKMCAHVRESYARPRKCGHWVQGTPFISNSALIPVCDLSSWPGARGPRPVEM